MEPKEMETYLRTDFHCHTVYSKDSLTKPEKLIETCRQKKIDRLVVTDHNTIEGALRCKDISQETIIIGEEIKTKEGELLAAFVTREIPPGLSPMKAIDLLRDQGAFISVSHPFDVLRGGGWKQESLLEITPHVDAIETFNSRCMLPRFNHRARNFAMKHNLSGTHGSDSHAVFEVGRGTLLLPPFSDAQSLKRAIKNSVADQTILSSPLVHLSSLWAACLKKFT
jgi:hypothetical protein